jgi:uncharacterized protein with PIN domain
MWLYRREIPTGCRNDSCRWVFHMVKTDEMLNLFIVDAVRCPECNGTLVDVGEMCQMCPRFDHNDGYTVYCNGVE